MMLTDCLVCHADDRDTEETLCLSESVCVCLCVCVWGVCVCVWCVCVCVCVCGTHVPEICSLVLAHTRQDAETQLPVKREKKGERKKECERITHSGVPHSLSLSLSVSRHPSTLFISLSIPIINMHTWQHY